MWTAGLSVFGCGETTTTPATRREIMHAAVRESFELPGADAWSFRTPELWSVAGEQGRRYLQMAEPPDRPMLPGVCRVQEYAIYEPYEFRSFALSCFVRVDRDEAVTTRDVCILFGRKDDTHYYYVHLSGLSDEAHNTIMRVDGDTRVRLLPEGFRPSPVMTDRNWHKVDVLRNCDTGLIQVYVDAFDEQSARPYFEVSDKAYEWGFIGLGSFDNRAGFARVLIEGDARRPAAPAGEGRLEQ